MEVWHPWARAGSWGGFWRGLAFGDVRTSPAGVQEEKAGFAVP